MNKLSPGRQAAIIRCLCEGNSVRATSRMTGAAKGTILTLLRNVGAHASMALSEGKKKVTPAMAAGLTDRVWTAEDILGLLDA